MPNPFARLLAKIQFDGPNVQNRLAYIRAIFLLGSALHVADPTAYQATSTSDSLECLYRIRQMIGESPINVEIAQFFQENVR